MDLATDPCYARNGVIATVPFMRITKDIAQKIFVHPGDVVTVLRKPRTFMAFGATGRNAEIQFGRDELNLATALGEAGGLIDNRADPSAVFVFRHEPAKFVQDIHPESQLASEEQSVPVVYCIDFSKPSGYVYANSFQMRDGDILYVSDAAGAEVQKFLQILGSGTAPTHSAAVIYSALAHIDIPQEIWVRYLVAR